MAAVCSSIGTCYHCSIVKRGLNVFFCYYVGKRVRAAHDILQTQRGGKTRNRTGSGPVIIKPQSKESLNVKGSKSTDQNVTSSGLAPSLSAHRDSAHHLEQYVRQYTKRSELQSNKSGCAIRRQQGSFQRAAAHSAAARKLSAGRCSLGGSMLGAAAHSAAACWAPLLTWRQHVGRTQTSLAGCPD